MKSKLPNADELSIKYVVNELDPSEELLVEQAMINDEDMLIEVESLRQTLKKCEQLPYFSAPEHIIDAVMENAASYTPHTPKRIGYTSFRRYSYAAAATVLISAGVTWYSYTQDAGSAVVMEMVDAPGLNVEQRVQPWIDNRDILHVNTAGFGTAAQLDSAITPLRPLQDETMRSQPVRQLHLTGTQN